MSCKPFALFNQHSYRILYIYNKVDLSFLQNIDRLVLDFFNGSDSLFLDGVAMTFTSGLTWTPLYVALIYLVIKNNENMSQIFLIIGCALGCIFLADGLSDYIVKPLVGRWRPTNDPVIKYTIDVVNNYRENSFGFFSAHAANTMSLAVFLCLLVRNKVFTFALVTWSLLNCWTRLYLGVHYPSDILVGLVWGVIVGIAMYYTSTGYSHDDIDIVMFVMCLVLAYVVVWGGIRFSL